MANYENLKSAIQQVIKTNGNNEITGALLQQSLLAMINSLGVGCQFMGIATPGTNPGTPDQNVFYIGGPGTYPNFSASVVPDGYIGFFSYNGSWNFDTVAAGKNYDAAIAQLTKWINGYDASASHSFNSDAVEVYYYWENLNILQGEKFKITTTGTATWATNRVWLVTDASGISPGAGPITNGQTREFVANGNITKIGIRIYSLTGGGTIALQLVQDSKIQDFVGDKQQLETTEKDTVVGAINEIAAEQQTWSQSFSEIAEIKTSYNLFDKSAIVPGYITPSSGILSGYASGIATHASSPLIPVIGGHYYYLTGRNTTSYGIRCFQADGTTYMKVLAAQNGQEYTTYALPNIDATNYAGNNGQFKVPANAAFVQFTVRFSGNGSVDNIMLIDLGEDYVEVPYIPPYKSYGTYTEIKDSALPDAGNDNNILSLMNGKSIRIFGGSVAALCDRFGGIAVMADLLKATIVDSAVSGAGFCRGTTIVDGVPNFALNSIPDQVNKAVQSGQPKYDVYVFWCSTNDAAADEVGNTTDYTYFDNYNVNKLTTQDGGMNYCIKTIQTFAPEAHIIVFGSMKWFDGGASLSSNLKTFVDHQEQVALLQSLPFLSLWANAGVNYYNKDRFFTWTEEVEGESRNDGTHPNAWAYQNVIAPKIAKQIALLY